MTMDVVQRMRMQAELCELTADQLQAQLHMMQWRSDRRKDQMPPGERWTERDVGEGPGRCSPEQVGQLREDWFTWMLMAGRGSGKTRTGAEDAWSYGWLNPGIRYAIVAPTNADVVKTCYEGESGLLARCPPLLVQSYNRQDKVLVLTNGSMYFGYSAEEPDRLRGPQHHRAWCDELAAWRYLDDTLDNLLMGLRLGTSPRIIATTTPRPLKRIREIHADPTTVVSTVSTYANMANLPRIFVDKILKRYEGTRLGRQELEAAILDDTPGALWNRVSLDDDRVLQGTYSVSRGAVVAPDGRVIVQMTRVIVAVDPASGGTGGEAAESGDEYGIVVVGLGTDGVGYVLADLSASASPGEFGRIAVRAYDDWRADRIIYEANNGGEHIRQTIVTSAAAMRLEGEREVDFVPTEAVWASRGKVARAEPVSALYEQHRVRHVGTHGVLENQMCEFTTDFDKKKMGYSPDRVDALVWGVTHLMLNDSAGTNVQDFYRREHGEVVAAARGSAAPTTVLIAPEGLSTVVGMMGHQYTVGPDRRVTVHKDDAPPLLMRGFREADS